MANETDIRHALVTYLSGLPGLLERVPGGIRPMRHRMGEPTPRVRYQLVGQQRVRSANEGPCGTGQARFQIDVFSAVYDDGVTVGWLIKGTKADPRLDGFHGMWGDYHIDEARVEDEADEWDEPADGSDEGVYRQRLDVLVIYTEPGG